MRLSLVCTPVALSLSLLVLSGCGTAQDPWKGAAAGQKRILTSFPPLYSMTKAVAGPDAYVLCLVINGIHEPHDDDAQLLKLHRADLVLCNGLGLDEHFVRRRLHVAGNRSVKVVEVGEELPEGLKLHSHEEADEKEEHKGHEHHHHHGDNDPHVWLGPPQAIALVRIIAEQLARLDPAHKDGYAKRADDYSAEIEKMQHDGKELLKGKKNLRIVTMHDSLAYFAKAFDLTIVGSLQSQAGDDPDGTRLAQVADLCKKTSASVITIEPQYPTSLAEKVQSHLHKRGVEVRLVQIDTLETAAPVAGSANPDPGLYLQKMRENIEHLAKDLR